MPTYRHPRAPHDVPGQPPAEIHVSRGETASVDGDGTFEAPESVAEAIAAHEGVSVDSMRVGGSDEYDPWTDDSKADLIEDSLCPWCNEYDGDHVSQHASSAHPDEWDAYKED